MSMERHQHESVNNPKCGNDIGATVSHPVEEKFSNDTRTHTVSAHRDEISQQRRDGTSDDGVIVDTVQRDEITHRDKQDQVHRQKEGDKASMVRRLALNPNKAGMQGMDREKVNKTIYEMSKGSRFFNNQEERDATTQAKVQKMVQQLARYKADGTLHRKKLLESIENLVLKLEDERDLSRVIVHCDMDAYFASVEELDNPALKGIPMAVGGIGMLTTCNYEARKYGVRSAMPGYIALQLCPQLKLVKGNYPRYQEISNQTREIFARYDPEFSSVGLDEAYIDITDHLHILNLQGECTTAEEVVAKMRQEVFTTTGITCSAGITANRMLSKVCSDLNKPNGQYSLHRTREAILAFLQPLPIRKISGIGKVSEQILNGLGITTCGEMYNMLGALSLMFQPSSFGFFSRVSLGIGRTRPEARERKSIGHERTFGEQTSAHEQMATCHNLCRLVYSDMKKLGLKGRTVTLKLKFTDFKVITRASSLTDPTQSLTVISAETIRLLTKEQTRGGMLKLRLLGVRITHLAEVNDSESHTSENIPVQKNITSYFGNRQSLRRQQVSGGNTLKNTLADVGMDGVRNNGMVSEDSGTTYDNASSGHAVGTRENADRNRTASPGIVSGNTGITSIGQEIGVNPLNSADMKCCERPDIVWMNYSEGGPCGNGLVRESGVEVGCGDSRVVDAKNSHTSSGVEVLIQDKLTNEPGVGYSEGRVGDVINSRDTTERMQDCETRGGTDNELVGTNKLARARAPANISKPCDSWALDERGGLFGDGVERLKEEVSNSADNKKTFEKLRHRYGIEEYMCDSTRVNIERTSGPSRTVKAVPVIAPSGSSNDKNKNTGTTTERHAIRDESSFETDVQRIAVNSTPIDHRPRDMEDIREHLGKCTEIGGSCHDSEGVRIGTKDDSATAIASYGEDHTQQGQGELCDPTHTISAGNMTSATAEATNTIVKGTIADSSLGESVCESVCLDSDVSNKEMRTNSRDDSPTLDGKGLSVSAKKRKGTQLERWLASTARDACTRTSLKGTPLVASTKLPGSVLRGVGAGRHTVSVGAKKRKPTSLFEATSKSKKYKNTGKLRAVHDGAGTLARQRSSSSWKHAQASTPDGLGMPKHRPASVERETVPCPICGADLSAQDNSSVNQHIDLCLNRDQIYLHPP